MAPSPEVARPIDFATLSPCRLHCCPLCSHLPKHTTTVTITDVSETKSDSATHTAIEPTICDICAQAVPPTSLMACAVCRYGPLSL